MSRITVHYLEDFAVLTGSVDNDCVNDTETLVGNIFLCYVLCIVF